ncbi:MAG: cell envelope biogenesis protein OmpA, partial [Bacteroidota bacterium]
MASQKSDSTQDKDKLQQLRELLLIEDRKAIAEIQQVIETREDLAQRVDPIIEDHLEELEKNFPDAYIRVVQKLVDDRMRQKQDELINLIYPRLGIMVKKFINNELRLLREKVDRQIRRSPLAFVYKNRNKSSDEILIDLHGATVEEVYVISHESGLLLGSASASETADKDMIAGMLTAIKSFVEDAFKRTDEELRAIQYGNYEIMVQNFF